MVRIFSAGGVVYKKENRSILWLVAKNTPSELFPGEIWRLPKGWLDDRNDGKYPGPLASGEIKATDKQIRKAALEEVSQEGGVEAKIIKKIGTDKYFMKRGEDNVMKFVTFYLMEWARDLPEGPDFETSEVAWLTFPDARKRLTYSNEKKVLDKAQALL